MIKEFYSVELAPDFSDDTFNGSLKECIDYCKNNDYVLCRDARIAHLVLFEFDNYVLERTELLYSIID